MWFRFSLLCFICSFVQFRYCLPPPGLLLSPLFSCVYRTSSWNDAIWLPSSFSMISMATTSNDWGRGSSWPIVSKLHFSEWFPLSCYWNRAPALWWIHLVIHSLEGKRGKVQTWHRRARLAQTQWLQSEQTHKHTYSRAKEGKHATVAAKPHTPFWTHLLIDYVLYFLRNDKSSRGEFQVHKSPLQAVY